MEMSQHDKKVLRLGLAALGVCDGVPNSQVRDAYSLSSLYAVR
jgi:hypothetical protein